MSTSHETTSEPAVAQWPLAVEGSSYPSPALLGTSSGWFARLADYLELAKPKIALLELATVAVAAGIAGADLSLLVHVLLGTALVAGSASALNQWLERTTDRHMARTRNRPLPAGRVSSREVVLGGLLAGVVGVAYLGLMVNLLTALLGLVSWLLYVVIYTPMKRYWSANTMVGAVAGAMPVLMGWSAMGQPLDVRAAVLFGIVFLWQFPHFMAIAWMYRHEYRAAGIQMLSVVDPSGIRAGGQAVSAALALLPVSLIPAILPGSGSVRIYFLGALALALGQLIAAVVFMIRLDDVSARRLLRASLIYLPSLLLLLMLATPA